MSISITNDTRLNPLLQDISSIPWNILDPQPTIPHIIGTILAFNPARMRVLDSIIRLGKKFDHIYTSQDKISKISKAHRVTVNREIKYLSQIGLIAKKNNGAHKTCWYKVSSFFNDLDVQEMLKTKLSIFYFKLRSLLSRSNHHATLSIKDLRNNIYIKTKTRPLPRKSTKKGETMFEVEQEIRQDIASLPFKMSIEDQKIANTFTKDVVKRALHKVMASQNVKQPAKLFLWKCKELAAATGVADGRGVGVKHMVKKPIPTMPCSINPLITKNEEENHQRWEEYIRTKTVTDYLEYYPTPSQFNGPQVIQRQHEKYLAKLATYTQENRSHWAKTAAKTIQLLPTQGQMTSMSVLMHNLVIETCNTSPEFEPGCPTTQDKKIDEALVKKEQKDLIETKLDYMTKYQSHPNFVDLAHWIETINDNDNPNNLENIDEFVDI